MVGPRERAGQVGNDQADEGQRPAGRHGGAGEQGDRGDAGGPGQGDVLAEGTRDVLAEGQGVEAGRVGHGEHQSRDDEGQDLPGHRGVPPGDRPDLPEPEHVHGLLVEQDDRGRERVQERADGGAGQGQRDRGRPAAASGQPDGEHRGAGDQGAGEAEPDVAVDAAQPEDHDAEHHRERRPLGDAEQPGVGQGVAGVSLHQRARDAQRQPGEQPERRTGDAEAPHDDVALLPGRAPQCLPDVAGGDRLRPDRDAEDDRGQHRQGEPDQDEDRAGTEVTRALHGHRRHDHPFAVSCLC